MDGHAKEDGGAAMTFFVDSLEQLANGMLNRRQSASEADRRIRQHGLPSERGETTSAP
jgi:hypothetical protein